MGALTEHHRCPRGWFSRFVGEFATVAVGAGLGVVPVFAVYGQPAPGVVLAAGALGAILTRAVRSALGPRF
jgi:hypothetical protein